MIDRRTFLGGSLAALALGWAGLTGSAIVRSARSPTVAFYLRPASPAPTRRADPVLERAEGRLGTPEQVAMESVRLGHFHGLIHAGDGRVSYLYEAVLAGPSPRRGFVALSGAVPA